MKQHRRKRLREPYCPHDDAVESAAKGRALRVLSGADVAALTRATPSSVRSWDRLVEAMLGGPRAALFADRRW